MKAGQRLAGILGGTSNGGASVRFGTIKSIDGSSITVAVEGEDQGGISASVECMSADAGDRVLLITEGSLTTAVCVVDAPAPELRTDFTWKPGWAAWSTDMSARESPCFIRKGGVVSIFGAARNTGDVSAGVSQQVEICVLPKGFRPPKEYIVQQQISQLASCMIGVRTDGTIYVERASTTTIPAWSWVNIACTFVSK